MEITPDNITIDRNAAGLKLVKNYRSGHMWSYIPFVILWAFLLVRVYPQSLDVGFPAPFLLALLFNGGVGLYIIYYCLTSFFNKTEIVFEYGSVIIKDAPLPMGNTGTLSTADIEGFYVFEKAGFNRQRRTTFQVRAKLRDGKSEKIIRRIYTRQECEFLVQQFNKAVGYEE